MSEKETVVESSEDFEVTELDDGDLEDVAGGDTNHCTNTNCSCQPD